jgi:hypothetical protein
MPANYRIRLYDQKRIRPFRPHSAQHDPEQSVGTAQRARFVRRVKTTLPQGNDFKSQNMTRTTKLLSHMNKPKISQSMNPFLQQNKTVRRRDDRLDRILATYNRSHAVVALRSCSACYVLCRFLTLRSQRMPEH